MPLVHARAEGAVRTRSARRSSGLLKSTLLQLDSTFSERSYGAGSFRDFVEKLAKLGVVTLSAGQGRLARRSGRGRAGDVPAVAARREATSPRPCRAAR